MDQTSQCPASNGKPADQFLANATLGLNRWWVWILGTVSIVVIWQGIGAIPTIAACEFVKSANLVDFTCNGFVIHGASSIPGFVLNMYGFVIAMIGIWIVVRRLHRRPFTAVLTARLSFDHNRVFFAMLVGLVIFGMLKLLPLALGSEVIEFQSPDAWEYTTFFMFAIALISIQAGFEEVFFRGYLMQAFSLLTRSRVVLAISTAVVFTLLHLANPEPWEYGVVPYVASIMSLGVFFALLTLLDGGIELAVGIHVSNNLFVALVANTSVSALQTPALFLIEIDEYHLIPGIPILWLMLAIVLMVFNCKYKWFSYRQTPSILKRQRDS